MRLNQTSVWKVMAIWISRVHSWFNFELLDVLCTWIGLPFEKSWPFEFLDSFRCLISSISIYYATESDFCVACYDHLNLSRAFVFEFWASRYIMRLNRTSLWKVMTIWISPELPVFNLERLDMWCAKIEHLFQKLWPSEFLDSFRCIISSVSIYYATESYFCLKSYDHLNFSRAFVFQFRASRYS